METAIPSIVGSPKSLMTAFKEIKEPNPTQEDIKLALISELSTDPRWEAVVEYIDGLITRYVNVEITPTDTPESVGVKYMVAEKVMKILEPLRKLPELMGEQYDQQQREERAGK